MKVAIKFIVCIEKPSRAALHDARNRARAIFAMLLTNKGMPVPAEYRPSAGHPMGDDREVLSIAMTTGYLAELMPDALAWAAEFGELVITADSGDIQI